MSTSLMPSPRQRFYTDVGLPAAGCLLYTYAAGTGTLKNTFTDSAGLVPHQNPITLDAKGEALIYWTGAYKVDLKTALGAQISGYPVDNFITLDGQINTAIAAVATLRADLIAADGAEIVSYTPSWAGAGAVDLQTKAIETVSILEAGGLDDWDGATGTNNFAAIELLCARAPIHIHCPRTDTGVYVLSGTTALLTTAGVIIDADEGVSFRVQGAGRTPLSIAGLKSTRFLNVYHETLRYSQPLGPQMFVKPSEKPGFMSGNAGELHKPISINFTTDAYSAKLASWPNGALTRYTPTSTTASAVVHPNPGALFAGTFVSVVPGDQIMAEITSSANYPSVMVQTVEGWVVLWAAIGASAVNSMELIGGVGVGLATDHPVLINSAYNLDKAMVGVCIYDEKTFGLIVNGILIKRYTTATNIVAAGWSGGFGAAAFTIATGVGFRSKRTIGVKPLKLVCLGDSISESATTLRSHFNLAAQYLTGMGGFQIDTLTNLAVAGETSGQQLTRLQALPIAGYDCCLVQVGVNDIQTATAVATFVANITSMNTYCVANQVPLIVGLPTMWYSQTAAQVHNQDGAATGNENATGMTYRLSLMRKLSDLGIHCNTMVLEDEGAVIASLLSLSGADPVVSDNIHPTVYGSMLMGYSWAKAVAAFITSAPTDVVTSTFMDRAWFANPTTPATVPSYTVREGHINLYGFLSRGAAAWANGDVMGTLPKRLSPTTPLVPSVTFFDAGVLPLLTTPGCMTVDEIGQMKIYGAPVGAAFVAFSGAWRV